MKELSQLIDEYQGKLSIGVKDRNGDILCIGDNIIFFKPVFICLSDEEAKEYGYEPHKNGNCFYPKLNKLGEKKVIKRKGRIDFDVRYGYLIECGSSSPHRYDEKDGRLIHVEKVP